VLEDEGGFTVRLVDGPGGVIVDLGCPGGAAGEVVGRLVAGKVELRDVTTVNVRLGQVAADLLHLVGELVALMRWRGGPNGCSQSCPQVIVAGDAGSSTQRAELALMDTVDDVLAIANHSDTVADNFFSVEFHEHRDCLELGPRDGLGLAGKDPCKGSNVVFSPEMGRRETASSYARVVRVASA